MTIIYIIPMFGLCHKKKLITYNYLVILEILLLQLSKNKAARR